MKIRLNITILFSYLIICFLTLSCESKKTELQSKSMDGRTQITVSGNKTSMDPWDLTIKIKKDEKSDSLKTQLYVDELNTENVAFTWQDEETCIITLTDRDGTQRNILIGI